jgi:glycosyltransferase involved in cell wall biosynthesis
MDKFRQNKLRLVVGINDFRIGGGQKIVADVLARTDRATFEIHLVTLIQFDEQESFYNLLPADISVHRFYFQRIADVKELLRLYKLLKHIRPDVVWSSFFFSNTIFRVLKPLTGYKVIVTEQNTYTWKTTFQKVVDWILSYITYRIVAVSNYVAEFTAAQERIPRKKFTVIHNGVDVEEMIRKLASADVVALKKELGFRPDDRLIINVGQLIHQKNQQLLVTAFKHFSERVEGYRLVILGEGILRPQLEQHITSLGLRDLVVLPGIKKNVADYYAASDFFVLTSRFEGFSVAVVEALSAGLPVISTRVSGAEEYIDENRTGFIVSDDADDIARTMEILAGATEEEQQLRRNAARAKAKMYDLESITRKYETLFKESVQS